MERIEEIYRLFQECGEVTTDSRHCPKGSMFIALKGATFNGNAFAAQAVQAGCRYALVDEAAYADPACPAIVQVDDCLQTLQQLARFHRRKLGTRIVGVTGTNGKTTTKELLSAVLKQTYRVLATQGNLNNAIGVPLTLLRLTEADEVAVVEMGASHPGDIRELVEIVEPDYGLITNVGLAHLQGFGSLEGVIRTKGELYDYLRTRPEGATVFLQNENPYLNEIAHGLRCLRYGQSEGLYVSGRVTGCSPFLKFRWTADGTSHDVQTRLIGAYNLDNALAAVAVGRFFAVGDEQICQALATYEPQNNRSQLKQTARNRLVVDAYNANPTSMRAALLNFRQMEAPRKMVILGDMKELGASSGEEHRQIVELLKTCSFDRVVLVGPEFAATCPPFPTCATVEQVKDLLHQDPPRDYYILIKGSNSMKLAQLAECEDL
ncbi:MAG: UDP-N-acetylmuramoyl-tripeptide--D-alanyl-D-alanine ligase [Phocaeicola plebeius]